MTPSVDDALALARAEAALEEASGVIANGYLRSDREAWIRAVEKRRAARSRCPGLDLRVDSWLGRDASGDGHTRSRLRCHLESAAQCGDTV